ncbi:MAG: hypothetical protein ACLFWB_08655 [Armatimonadota bacterium]
MSEPAAERSGRWRGVVIGLLAVMVIALLVVCAGRADTIYDEGGYSYEGWLVVARGWQPFADFHTKTLPGLQYLYGLGQALFPPGLTTARAEACVFTLLTLLLAFEIGRRLGGPWAGAVVLGLFGFNLQALVRYCRALAFAPTAFFLMLSVYLLIDRDGPRWKLYGGCVAAAVMVFCRHDLIVVAAVLWIWAYLKGKTASERYLAPLSGIALLIAAAVYFWIRAPFNFTDVMFKGAFTPDMETVGTSYSTAVAPTAGSVVWHLMMFVRWYTAPLLLVAPVAGYVLHIWRAEGEIRSLLRRHSGIVLLLALAAANYLAHVAGSALFGYNIFYMLDFYIFFPVIAASAAAFTLCVRRLRDRSMQWQLAAVGIVAVCVPLWTAGIPAELTGDGTYPAARIQRGAQVIADIVPAGEPIFTIDDPHQFLAARREVLPPLTHQLFLFRDTPDTEGARRRHAFNYAMIDRWLSGEVRYVVISEGFVDWMLHSGRYEKGQRLYDFIHSRLADEYTLVEAVDGSFRGPTRIYRFAGEHR